MLHFWKSAKQKRVYDTASGAVLSLTSLEYKMIQAIIPPLSPLCPSSLRYELAKYDSTDVEEAYEHLYALHRDHMLFAQDEDGTCRLRVGGAYGVSMADDCVHEIAAMLGGVVPTLCVDPTVDEDTLRQIRTILGQKA